MNEQIKIGKNMYSISSIDGEIIDVDKRDYSRTHVSGGGGHISTDANGRTSGSISSVSSSSTQHTRTEMWIKTSKGEEVSATLNSDFSARQGHEVVLLFLKNKAINLCIGAVNKQTTQKQVIDRESLAEAIDFDTNFMKYTMIFCALAAMIFAFSNGKGAWEIVLGFFLACVVQLVIVFPPACFVDTVINKNMEKKALRFLNETVDKTLKNPANNNE